MIVVSLFDESGNMVRPWAEAGHTCYCLDIVNTGAAITFESGGSIDFLNWDATDADAKEFVRGLWPNRLFSFAPCTDLAGSGARHFATKALANPDFQNKAAAMVRLVEELGEELEVRWMLENPVGVLSRLWRKPDHTFNPSDYGGYLPEGDEHPRWPKYIAPRDAYPKKTCIWSGNGFVMPEKRPVHVRPGWSDQQKLLGGKSSKTKQIRSETPRGFAQAVFEANT